MHKNISWKISIFYAINNLKTDINRMQTIYFKDVIVDYILHDYTLTSDLNNLIFNSDNEVNT